MAKLHRAMSGGIGAHGPVVTKGDGVWRGKTNLPYLPKDPERRANLLRALGITPDQLLTPEDFE
jgi:hypothetical protein